MAFNIYRTTIDSTKYLQITYLIKTNKDLKWAAWQLATGQSVGNPNIRNAWETDEMFEKHSCVILDNNLSEQSGSVTIGFPIVNFDFAEDGITQILTSIMGGQLDIKGMDFCQITDIQFPDEVKHYFKGPKYGITGLRQLTKTYNKPLLLGIIKPKIITSTQILQKMVEEMIEGGCNLIKEDEIHSNPACCSLRARVHLIQKILKGTNVVYFHTVNADPPYVLERAKLIVDLGGNGIHVNFWAGLGIYKAIRDANLPIALHFQTSGNKILTDSSHKYSIAWPVLCKLVGMCGIDMAHAGMIGGYGNYSSTETLDAIHSLKTQNVLPSMSCGMTPGNIGFVTKQIGIDYAAGVGGSLHGHNLGSKAGARACIQAINQTGGIEYDEAIRQWGLKQ